MSGLKVITPGFLSLVQDRGRFGFMHLGMDQAGALDERSMLWANRLLGNAPNEAVLEVALGNLKLEALGSGMIAVVALGAKGVVKINDQSHALNASFAIKSGDSIQVPVLQKGVRVYIAYGGGFAIQEEFGSCSVSLKNGLGYGGGKALAKGDVLEAKCGDCVAPPKRIPSRFDTQDEVLTLRVIAGYQYDDFSDETKNDFFGSIYEVTDQADRMGYRLNGASVSCGVSKMVSEGISFGAIQVPDNGQPIVLLKDRQTIGGYPKIGTVLSLDCFRLAQRRSGEKVHFKCITPDEAKEALKAFYGFFNP